RRLFTNRAYCQSPLQLRKAIDSNGTRRLIPSRGDEFLRRRRVPSSGQFIGAAQVGLARELKRMETWTFSFPSLRRDARSSSSRARCSASPVSSRPSTPTISPSFSSTRLAGDRTSCLFSAECRKQALIRPRDDQASAWYLR